MGTNKYDWQEIEKTGKLPDNLNEKALREIRDTAKRIGNPTPETWELYQSAQARLDEISREKYINKPDYEVVNDKNIDAIKDNFTPPDAKEEVDEEEIYDQMESMGDLPSDMQIKRDLKKIDTNDNGEIEVDEMADFQKSLDDYASKNKKGRDDIPVTTRR